MRTIFDGINKTFSKANNPSEEAAKEPYKGFLCEACSNDNGSASPACGDDAPTQQYLASFHKEGEKNNHSCHAKLFDETEFEKYRIIQDRLFRSDFDRFDGSEEELPPLPQDGDKE